MEPQHSTRQRRTSRAFTLIETVVTMVLLAIVMAVVSNLFLSASMGYTSAAARSELHAELSAALERVVLDLRSARPKSGASPSVADITSTTPSSITWIDTDGTTRAVSLSGTDLLYSVSGAAGDVLSSSASSFGIATFDQSNVALATTLSGAGVESIWRVQVTIVGTRGGLTETLRTRVFPRAVLLGG